MFFQMKKLTAILHGGRVAVCVVYKHYINRMIIVGNMDFFDS